MRELLSKDVEEKRRVVVLAQLSTDPYPRTTEALLAIARHPPVLA